MSPEPETRVESAPGRGLVNAILVALLVSLSLAALVGLLVLLTKQSVEYERKVLASTFAFALFSATGLASATRFGRGLNVYVPLGWLGVAASGISLVLSVIAIWSRAPVTEGFMRSWVTVVLSALVLAYASLFLLVRPRATFITVLATITLMALGLIWILLMIVTWAEIEDFDVVSKLLEALGIITIYGTLASPILNRLFSR